MPSNILFSLFLILSTMIVISSPSWFCIWLGLEINMMMFIPLLYISNNKLSSESSLKYFLTQSIASMILLLTIMMMMKSEFYQLQGFILNTLMTMAMAIKSGTAPFHMWYPSVIEGLMWMQNLILMTWQKIAPLFTMNLATPSNLLFLLIIASASIGSISAMNQTSLRKIMAYSSITHISWMITTMLLSSNTWMIYMSIYFITTIIVIYPMSLMNLYHLAQIKKLSNSPLTSMMILLNLLSMGGFPPLLGFIGKWLTINEIMNTNMNFLIFVLILSSWINLYIYLQIIHPTLHIKSSIPKMNPLNPSQSLFIPALTIVSTSSVIFILL